jgi:hypothetical protein
MSRLSGRAHRARPLLPARLPTALVAAITAQSPRPGHSLPRRGGHWCVAPDLQFWPYQVPHDGMTPLAWRFGLWLSSSVAPR